MTTVEKTSELAGQKIIIAGGGIGGASGALALALRGADVTLYEFHPEFKEVGAGLQIGPHGVRLLEKWGLRDAAVDAGYLPKDMQFRDAVTAEPLLTLDFGEEFNERYGAPYLVIHRSDLLNLLVQAAADAGANMVNNVQVLDAQRSDNGVKVQIKNRADDSEEEVEADLMIAFDGSHSTFRQKIVQDDIVPSAYVAYRGTAPLTEDPELGQLKSVIGYIGPRAHFVQYPLRGGELLNQVAVFQSPRYLKAVMEGEEAPEDWGNNEEFRDGFGHTHERIQSRLGSMWLDKWWQMADREPLKDWVINDRMIVMGDAAHPPLQYIASGAIMAMEDAETIASYAATAAREGNLDWGAVLRDVSDERAPRCGRIQTTSRLWGEMWHLDGIGRHVRNQAFHLANENGWFIYADWLWDYNCDRREYLNDPSRGELPQELRDWEYKLHTIARLRDEGKTSNEMTL